MSAQTDNETVLVTGAARRIGRAIALDLGRRGHRVAIHYNRSVTEAENVADEIRRAGGTAITLAADLAREDEVRTLIARTAALGPLTCLINNASVFDNDDVFSATRESWDRHIEANLRAPFVLTQEFARQLPPGRAGNVINLIDQCVWNLTPGFVSYTLSKAGLWTLTRTLAMALAPRIRVNGIGPGPTLPSARQTPESFARQRAAVPLQRGATPEEISDTVRFILASPALTGQMIALDGGQHLVPWAGAFEAIPRGAA